jgi:hypothetical protein
MDPFTIALATFGIQKLRGKSTKRSLRDAAIAGGLGQLGGMAGIGPFQAFGRSSAMPAMFQGGNFIGQPSAAQIAKLGTDELTIGEQLASTPTGSGLSRILGKKDLTNKITGEVTREGSGFLGLSPGMQLGIGAAGLTALGGEDEQPEMPEGTRPEDYEEAKKKADEQLEGILNTYQYDTADAGSNMSPYNYNNNPLYTFHKGGIAEVRKFNQGGINYLPSKTDHNEKDINNYVRATGYVEDGSGNGDKDEDTMLAQLADGEFVSRADAILGAGIMEGANPTSYKDMRKKGAAFFYGQQAKFKRIFDLLDAARKEKN